MIVKAVCIGTPEPVAAKSGKTGYFKMPQSGPVTVTRNGLVGDFIGDLEHHGGVDQAVYIFGGIDRDWWQAKLGRNCPAGFFGENLAISGLESATLCLGDILLVGDMRLQITSPRIPCATYHAVMNDKSALKDFYNAGRPGAYARVLTTGDVRVGDAVTHLPFAGERITILENMRAYQRNFDDPAFLRRALTVPAHHELHDEARAMLSKLP